MDKTTPQSKRQEMNSTSHEMCDKAADTGSQAGMVDSSAASFNERRVSVENAKEKKNTVGSIKRLEDLDHCKEMLDHCKEMLTMTCVWKQNRLVPRRSIW